MTERRFFTDEERQAKVVEMTLAGDMLTCIRSDCRRRFVRYQLDIMPTTFCPACMRQALAREYALAGHAIAGGPETRTTYLVTLKSKIDALDGIIWEQRWIPN